MVMANWRPLLGGTSAVFARMLLIIPIMFNYGLRPAPSTLLPAAHSASTAAPLGRQCDTPVYYGVQHCTDDGGQTHIITVDLTDPHVHVQTVFSNGPSGECNSVNVHSID